MVVLGCWQEVEALEAAAAPPVGLQLRLQMADHHTGRSVSNRVRPAALTERGQEGLRDASRAGVRAKLTRALSC